MSPINFSRKEWMAFVGSAICITTGFLLMGIDPAPNGFGILTLWLAPPVLLAGFLLPALALLVSQCPLRQALADVKMAKAKHVSAIIVFAISFAVYLQTLEPTASLWDCAEFIAAAYKLQVPHTPGTPLSLLIARLFTMASFGDVQQVAWTINLMSGLFSALTVFLTHHVIYMFGQAILPATKTKSDVPLIAASVCGSLCLAFSDSFWFSAVEAETYGLACFFLMLLTFLILKGKDISAEQQPRQLILIAYIAGLSYCIHPMCLLVLPLLPFTWYTVDKKITFFNLITTVGAGLITVFMINRIVAVGMFEGAFFFDRMVVNNLNLTFYSGAIIFIILIVATFVFLLKKYPRKSAWTWAIIFLLFGFSPYLLLFIRSNHNPPIDESNPENLPLIKAYMNREGYPSSPLLYGPYFDADVKSVSVKKSIYYKDESQYKIAGRLPEYHYDKSRLTILPRMYSHDINHIETYRKWTGLKPNEQPRFVHNIKFFLKYQLGHMYLRYLLWNFAGRESDVMRSEWLKPWEGLSSSPHQSKARNQYWMIPLLLGVAGMLFQYKSDKKGFFTNAIFFLVTGIILVIYLNSPPNEPRERDYIYVASYISFSIWTGLGVLFLYRILPSIISKIHLIIGAAVPLWMLFQNWDDHDRSGRTFQIDHARTTLNSCAQGAILFTGGDNDTFPLWYLQEVEGFRTDVRVVVLSYFNTDWYINQLRKQHYDSPPFRLTLTQKDYRQYGPNDVLYVSEQFHHSLDVRKFIQLLGEEHPALTMSSNDGDPYHIIPSRTLSVKVPANITSDQPDNEMTLKIEDNYLEKNALAILDLIVSNDWKRPVYFNFTAANSIGIDFSNYLQQVGLVFRLLPTAHASPGSMINKELMQANLIDNADYTNLIDKDVYFTYEDHFARIVVPLRQSFNQLAEAWLEAGEKEKAREVLQYAMTHLYPKHLPPSFADLQAASLLLFLKEENQAEDLSKAVFDYFYFKSLTAQTNGFAISQTELRVLRMSSEILSRLGYSNYQNKLNDLK